MGLDSEQRGVARGMAAGGIFSLAVLVLASLAPPLALPASDGMADRLAFTARADLVLVLWLVAAVASVAKGRFFSPHDIAGSGLSTPSAGIAIGRAIIQNTHEQATIAAGAHLALATLLPMRLMGLIPALALLFCIGRATFWLGYSTGAAHRAFGFATTFYPTVFAALLATALLLGAL